MFKVAILALAFFAVVLADTTFETVPAGSKSVVVPKPGDVASYPEGYSRSNAQNFADLTDKGGNWGDNIWGKRADGDVLISRQIQVNDKQGVDQQFKWQANFPNKKITQIRFLNIGRERALVATIAASNGPAASAVVALAKNLQFRLLIEVYVK